MAEKRSGSSSDQRRTPRINVRNRLTGKLVSLDVPVVVRDFSLGGFSVETDAPLPEGVHVVRLEEGDRWSVTVTAASRHTRSTRRPDGSARHITGFEYEDQSADTKQTIRVLFERLAAEQPSE